jgi:hypothetical protein
LRGAAALALVAAALPASAQTLVSDAEDYIPGQTAWLAGADFQPGEVIGLSLRVETSSDAVIDYAVGGVEADSLGGFLAAWLVPVEALNSQITATAIGMSSGRLAVAHFTDSHGVHNIRFATSGLPAGHALTITGSRTNPGHNVAPYTASFTSPGPSASTGCQAGGSSVSFAGFPASFAVANGSFDLVGLSKTSPFATGAAGGTTTVTASYAFVPAVTCPENNAPLLSASPADLGQRTGCLSGSSLSATVRVFPQDFAPVTSDPDGDPVGVRLANAEPDGGLTLVLAGPGLASANVTLIAEDDPSARNQAGCSALVALSASAQTSAQVQVVFAVEILPPLTSGGVGLFKQGSTIPLKFRLKDCSGIEVPPTLLGLDSQPPTADATVVSSLSPQGDGAVEDSGASNDDGLAFRYGGTFLQGGSWIYNLSTKGLGWTPGLLYRVRVDLIDGTTRDLHFTLKK